MSRPSPSSARSTAQTQKQCDDWNAANPIGAAVRVKRDDGSFTATRTRSEAYVLSGHTAVIFLEGISGCYLLSRVEAADA